MSKQKRTKLWPPIYTQTNRSGQLTYYVDLRAVAGGRPGFPTLAQAQTRAEQARTKRDNEGNAAFMLPMDIRLDANKANDVLAPHGVTIFEAAEYYSEHVLAYKNAPLIKDLVNLYVAEGKQVNNRDRTIGDKRSRLNAFAEQFGERRLSDIAVEELKDWIFDDEWEPRTQINYITKVSQLYNFALNHRPKWVDSNITELIRRPMVDETDVEFFSVDECQNLLSKANEFGLLPCVALGLFAGLRIAEMARLDPKDINLDLGIRIGGDVAKKRGKRTVDITPALKAWLEPFREQIQNGSLVIIGPNFQRDRNRLIKAAGLAEWKANGLRHSFGTYHFGAYANEGETSKQMGNSPDVLHAHYKGLVTREAAEKFWSLRPIKAGADNGKGETR